MRICDCSLGFSLFILGDKNIILDVFISIETVVVGQRDTRGRVSGRMPVRGKYRQWERKRWGEEMFRWGIVKNINLRESIETVWSQERSCIRKSHWNVSLWFLRPRSRTPVASWNLFRISFSSQRHKIVSQTNHYTCLHHKSKSVHFQEEIQILNSSITDAFSVKIVTGNFQGILRIYLPTKRGMYQNSDLLLEQDLGAPILQVAAGRLIPWVEISFVMFKFYHV